MKILYWILGIVLILLIVSLYTLGTKDNDTVVLDRDTDTEDVSAPSPVQVTPISHATVALEWAGATIVTDPVGTSTALLDQSAEVILITDIHGDHLSTSTLARMSGSSTIIAPQAVTDMLSQDLKPRTITLDNNESTTTQGFTITAIPMYNLPEADDSRHTKGRGNGYIIERDDYRVYIAGDTSGTPEMRALDDIDIAFVPMNLPFTMSVEDAADAVRAFEPRQVYPYHYRGQDGLADVNKFKQLVEDGNDDIVVILRDWYPQQ